MASWKRVITTSDDSAYKNSNVNATDIDANVSNAEFGFLSGVTSDIQTQINNASASGGLTNEEVQDIVGTMLTGNTETNISVTYDDSSNEIDFIVPTVSALTKGVIGIGYTTSGKNYKLQVDASGNGYVNVPWSDSNTQLSTEQVQDIVGGMVDGGTETRVSVTYDDTNGKLGFVVDDMNDSYTLPLASSSARGGIKVGYTENGKNYPVELSSEKAYVNVPWTNSTYSAGTGLTLAIGNVFSLDSSASPQFARLDVDQVRINDGTVQATSGHLDLSAGSGNEVRIQDSLSVAEGVVVGGNLTVSGTTTTINTETVTIQDNIIVLNSNSASTPTEDAGFEVERGSRANVNLMWDESGAEWTSKIYKSSANDTVNYIGRVGMIERASSGTSGSDNAVGSMFINTGTGNFYIYS